MRRVVKEHGGDGHLPQHLRDPERHQPAAQPPHGLSDRINVIHGVFEDIPEPASSFDIVWSQDAILHSDQRETVLREVWRVLKPGGHFVFTDPMQSDDADPSQLQPVYDRLQLNSLGSPGFYQRRRTRSASNSSPGTR